MKYEMTLEQIEKAFQMTVNKYVLRDGTRGDPKKRTYSINRVPREICEKVPEEGERRENHCLSVDFAKKTLTYLSWDESYHNGSSYNDYSHELSFKDVILLSDSLMKMLAILEEEEIKKEEEEKKRMEIEHRVWTRLQIS